MAQRLPEETREAIRQAYLGPREKAGVGEYFDHGTTSLFRLPTMEQTAVKLGVSVCTVWRVVHDHSEEPTPRRVRPLTPEEQQQILAAYVQGQAIRQIARAFAVSRTHISVLRQRAGIPKRQRWSRVSREAVA